MLNSKKQQFEKEFRDYLLFASIQNTRSGLWVSLILFFITAILSSLIFSDTEANRYLRHFGVMVPVFILTLAAISIKRFHKYLPQIFFALTAITALTVFFVGAASDINHPGYQYFFSWTMLVMMGTFAFYRIRFNYLMIVSGMLIAAFILSLVINGTLKNTPFVFFNNVAFIIDIFFIGFFIALFRENLMKDIFIRDRELESRNKDLKKEVRERRLAEIALKDSQSQYLDLIDSIPDYLYVLDQDLRVVVINNSIKDIHQKINLELDIIGKKATDIYGFATEQRINELKNVFVTGQEIITEATQVINNIPFHLETRTIPVFSNKKVVRVMVIIRDMSRKLEIEMLKQKNLEQKEILLREIHHRVKNNLAIVISLLDMQIRSNQNPEFIRMAREVEFRIRTMALIHEHLYKSEELDRVPLDKYLKSLAYKVISTCKEEKISLVDNLMPVDVKLETAMPIGLIVNEIITNACKYAFCDSGQGIVSLELVPGDADNNTYILTIRDNGKGLPDDFSIENPKSLGMLIINLLIKQIEAEILISNNNGTEFKIIFKGLQETTTN